MNPPTDPLADPQYYRNMSRIAELKESFHKEMALKDEMIQYLSEQVAGLMESQAQLNSHYEATLKSVEEANRKLLEKEEELAQVREELAELPNLQAQNNHLRTQYRVALDHLERAERRQEVAQEALRLEVARNAQFRAEHAEEEPEEDSADVGAMVRPHNPPGEPLNQLEEVVEGLEAAFERMRLNAEAISRQQHIITHRHERSMEGMAEMVDIYRGQFERAMAALGEIQEVLMEMIWELSARGIPIPDHQTDVPWEEDRVVDPTPTETGTEDTEYFTLVREDPPPRPNHPPPPYENGWIVPHEDSSSEGNE